MKLISAVICTSLALITLVPAMAGRAAMPPQHIAVTAKRFEYAPNDITVKKGEPVTISITSLDVDHGLKFKDLNVNFMVKKGKTGDLTFTPTQVGTFVGQCSFFCGSGHGSMKLTMHVTE